MTATCTCPLRWQRLHARIEGIHYEVQPTRIHTATSLLFRAWCTDCGTEYPYPFRLATIRSQAA